MTTSNSSANILMRKMPNKVGLDDNFFNLIKDIYKNPQPQNIDKLNVFHLKLGASQEDPLLPLKFKIVLVQFSSAQSLSRVWLFANPWITARQASLSITNSRSSLRLKVHQVNDAIQPSYPLSSPSPPAPNPSQHHSLFQWVN